MAPGFGVGAIFNVVIDPAGGFLCADVTALDGISFWAKAGTAGAKIDVNFRDPRHQGGRHGLDGPFERRRLQGGLLQPSEE
ncbi:MAG: hypothetical protein ABUL62_30065 [Myxococcales bacterium]